MPDIPRRIQECISCGSRDSFRVELGDPITLRCMVPGCGASVMISLEGTLVPKVKMPDA